MCSGSCPISIARTPRKAKEGSDLRIIELCTARIWGGGEVHLRDLCFGLLGRGHEVAVACLRGSPAYDIFSGDGLPVVPLTGKAMDLARYAARQRIDLVHAHQSKGAHLAAAVHFLAGKPRAILTRHVLAPARDLPSLGLARVIAVSRAVSAECLSAGVPPSILTVVPNGIDPRRYRPDFPPADRGRLGVPPGARLAVFAGRLAKDKGVQAAVEALLPLLARCDLYLALAGDGKKRSRLERIVERAGLGRKVIFLGWQADVRPFLAAADLVLAPGPGEAFGLAALEAMAMGRPVVAMEAGGVPEIIDDGVSGLLVPPGDGIALAAAVHRLVTRPELGQRLGVAARARALDFTLDKMVERTEEIMERTAREN